VNVIKYTIGNARFVSGSEHVVGTLEGSCIIPTPWAPNWVAGVCNYNGSPVVVFCGSSLLEVEASKKGVVIIAKNGSDIIGLLVTEFNGYADILGANGKTIIDAGALTGVLTGVLEYEGTKHFCINLSQIFYCSLMLGSMK